MEHPELPSPITERIRPDGLGGRAVKGALYLGISSFGTTAIGFFAGIILARLLEPSDFGVVALAGTLYSFVDIRSKMAIDQRYVQLDEVSDKSRNIFVSTSVILGLASVGISLVVAFTLFYLFQLRDTAIALTAVSLVGLSDSVAAAFRIHVEKQIAFKGVSIVTTLGFLVQFIASIAGAELGFGWLALIFGMALGSLATVSGFAIILRPKFTFGVPKRTFSDYLQYGLRFGVVYSFSIMILTTFDNLAVGTVSGTTQLGYYDRAYRIAMWPILIVSSVLQRVTLPAYRHLSSQPELLKEAVSMTFWLWSVVSLPIALTVFAIAPDLLLVAYGPKWLPAAPVLRVLVIFSLTRPLVDDAIALLVATGRSATMTRLLSALAILLIASSVPLTLMFGPVGTAAAVSGTFCLGAWFVFIYAGKSIGVSLATVVYKPILSAAFCLGGYALISSTIPSTDIAPLPRTILTVASISIVYYLLFFTLNRSENLRRARLIAHFLFSQHAHSTVV